MAKLCDTTDDPAGCNGLITGFIGSDCTICPNDVIGTARSRKIIEIDTMASK
jgi:hypothetical protein